MGEFCRKRNMVKSPILNRGDIIKINLNPIKGHEQAGARPVFVVSTSAYNSKTGMVVVCPITSKIKKYPFEVNLKNTKIKGVVLADQVRTIDYVSRKYIFLEKTDVSIFKEVSNKIKVLIS